MQRHLGAHRARWTAKDLAVNLCLSLLGVMFLLGGFELVTRMIGPHMGFIFLPGDENCLRRSSSLSVDFRPNCHGVLSNTQYSTNSFGMRGPELRDDGSLRILALGDSCTWGWQVGQDESYPAVLQTLLDARPGPARYQVLNAGVPGYTSFQGLTYLRERGVHLRPAVLIIGFGWNDSTPMGDVERQIAVERRLMPLMLFDDWLLRRSLSYRWVRYRGAVGGKPHLGERVPLEKTIRNLVSMIDLGAEHGAHVVMLNFWETYRPRRYAAIVRTAKQRKLPAITYQGPRFDMVHPTVEGYRWLAEKIVAEMERYGYLK